MKDFKKFCLFAMVLLVALLMIGVNVCFAGPFGLFPNWHPGQRVANGARVVVGAPGVGGCGSSLAEARYERRTNRRENRGYGGSCANGACQAPTGKPVQGPAQAPVQKK